MDFAVRKLPTSISTLKIREGLQQSLGLFASLKVDEKCLGGWLGYLQSSIFTKSVSGNESCSAPVLEMVIGVPRSSAQLTEGFEVRRHRSQVFETPHLVKALIRQPIRLSARSKRLKRAGSSAGGRLWCWR